MTEKIYSKEIPSNPEHLPEVEEFVMGIAEIIDLSHEKQNNLALSVAEAASNCIIHGNKFDENKTVNIKVTVNDSTIQISLKDQGTGFNPGNVPDPTAPENILKDSGRGIHIMRTFLDDLQYKFTDNGTEVILVLSR